MDIEKLVFIFAWMTFINVMLLVITSIAVVFAKEQFSYLHSKMFGIEQSEVKKMYFKYLANYKILIIVFNIVPLVVLKFLPI